MNTRIYVENLTEKKQGLSSEPEGSFTMSESAKGYKTHDTPDYANFHRTQLTHTHPPSTNSMLELSLREKEKLSSNTLYLSRQNKWNTLLLVACFTTRNMPIYMLE